MKGILKSQIIKRDGNREPFKRSKIETALQRAGLASGEFDSAIASRLADLTIEALVPLAAAGRLTVEMIQDAVETTLYQAGYRATLRRYVVYREQHAVLRQDRQAQTDVDASVQQYLEGRERRASAADGTSAGYSLGELIHTISGKVIANYWLNHVYPPEISQAHRSGELQLHDLDSLAGHCAEWSLRTLLNEGLNGVPGSVESTAPCHLSSAIGQIVSFLGTVQNEWAGAQSLRSFDTHLAPYVRKDGLRNSDVKQYLQQLIYHLNLPTHWGSQMPCIHLAFDWQCPQQLRAQIPVIGGEEMPFAYGDLQQEMDMINRAYIEIMMTGDAMGRPFTFPITSYPIITDFNRDSPNARLLSAMTARYALPHFQKIAHSVPTPDPRRSMRCRVQSLGSGEQTGSIGVVTINCAELGRRHRNDEAGLLAALDHLLELGRDSLEIKRKVIQRHMDNGRLPYTRRYLGTLRMHFSTLSLNGINELTQNFDPSRVNEVGTPAGGALSLRLLDHLRSRIQAFQTSTGHLYQLDAPVSAPCSSQDSLIHIMETPLG